MKRGYFFLLIFILQVTLVFSQNSKLDSINLPEDVKNRRILIAASTGTAVYAGASIWLWNEWYKGFELGPFHFYNDMNEWAFMDKGGHLFSAYSEARFTYGVAQWAGMSKKSSLWTSVAVGSLIQLTFEIMDGHSKKWGFSIPDVLFNSLGVGAFAIQEALWDEQRIQIKVSNTFAPYPNTLIYSQDGEEVTSLEARAGELYGTSLASRFLKDYNSMNIWLSVNPSSFMASESRFPKILNIALGYSAENLYGGVKNEWPYEDPIFFLSPDDYPRYGQWLLSLDLDLTKIKTRSRFLKSLLYVLNAVKIPSPTLEWNRVEGFKAHWLYW